MAPKSPIGIKSLSFPGDDAKSIRKTAYFQSCFKFGRNFINRRFEQNSKNNNQK